MSIPQNSATTSFNFASLLRKTCMISLLKLLVKIMCITTYVQQVHSGQCKSWAPAIAQAHKVLSRRQFKAHQGQFSSKVLNEIDEHCYCIVHFDSHKKILVSKHGLNKWMPSLTELHHPIIAIAITWTLHVNSSEFWEWQPANKCHET